MAEASDPRAQQRVGSVLNEKWTLEHLIGAGGMGAVYAARHRNGARSAVKVLHPELARIPEVRERFLREGYAANSVEHRGAVQVLDDDVVKDGPDAGSAYLVMELLEGESLQERVNRTPKLGERELLDVMDAVLDVLVAAHAHGVVHRDLKPENIFLARDPERDGVRVKVLDFGLARLTESATVTSNGMAVGTPSFMSPEQAAGRSDEIDGRTDIFALGATIFRIITGRRIHDADNMVQLVALMATVPAPRLRTVMPDVSESFARVIDRALAFDRADRYADAAAMSADVRAAIDMAVRDPAPSLQVISFSTRHARAGSMPEAAATPEAAAEAPRGRANTNGDLASVEKEAEFFEENSGGERGASDADLPSPRAIAQSTTLPWAIVLVLLALGAWKFGPTLQDELVRRASLEPVRQLWASASSSAATTPEAAPAAFPALPEEPAEPAPVPSTIDMDEDAGSMMVEDAPPDGGETALVVPVAEDHDAGAPQAVATARPHTPTPPRANKPPAKRPPTPTKKPPQQQRHR